MPHLNTKLSYPLKAGLSAEGQVTQIFQVFIGHLVCKYRVHYFYTVDSSTCALLYQDVP